MNEQDLINLKEQIDQAKSKADELRGRHKYLMQQLKDWDCISTKAARRKVKEMMAEIKQMQTQINQSIRRLEEKINAKDHPLQSS